jgi:hypothetical protein
MASGVCHTIFFIVDKDFDGATGKAATRVL